MSPNQVQLIIAAVNQFGPVFAELGKTLSSARGQVAVLAGEFTALHYTATKVFQTLNASVFEFSSNLETAQLGIASAYLSAGEYIDQATGKALEGQAALNAAQGDAARMLEELQVANLQTIATLDQLVRAYQETLPVAMAKGFDREKVKEFTVAMVQAAGAIGLSLDMLGEETRSLLTGAINPRTSRIATVLGLTNEDITRFKGDAQGLFDFLMQKLEAYRIAGIESQKTWKGLLSNTVDIFQQAGAQAFEPLFEGAKQGLAEITAHLVTVDAETQKITWNPEFLSGSERLREGLSAVVSVLGNAGRLVVEHRELVLTLVQAYVGLKASLLAYQVLSGVGESAKALYGRATAMLAERAALVAKAEAEAAAAAFANVHAQALLREAEASLAATAGVARLTAAETILAPAQARATAAATAHAAAETALASATSAASTATRAASAVMGALGGPLGLVITLLGTAATAWWAFGNRAEEAADKSNRAGESVLDNLREEIRLLERRGRLQGVKTAGGTPTDTELARLMALETRLGELSSGWQGKSAGEQERARDEIRKVRGEMQEINALIAKRGQLAEEAQKKDGYKQKPPPGAGGDKDKEREKALGAIGYGSEAFVKEEIAKAKETARRAREAGASAAEAAQYLEEKLADIRVKIAEARLGGTEGIAAERERLGNTLGLMKDFEAGYEDVKAQIEVDREKQREIDRLVGEAAEARLRDAAELMADLGRDTYEDVKAQIEADKDEKAKIERLLKDSRVEEGRLRTELNKVDTAEQSGGLGADEALSRRIALTEQLLAVEEGRLAVLAATSGTASADWYAQVDAIEAVRHALFELQQEQEGFTSGASAGLRNYAKAATDAFGQARDFASKSFSSMENALVEFVTTGKTSFKDLVNSILKDLIRLSIRQNVIGPLAKELGSVNWGGLFSGGGGSGVGTGAAVDLAGGGLYHSGGVVGAEPTFRRRVAIDLFANSRRYHTGGVVGLSSGEEPIIAKKGEAVLTPGQMKMLAPAASAPNVEVHVHADRDVKPRIEETETPGGGKSIDVYVDELVAANVAKGGRTAQTLQTMFGLSRRGR